MEEVFRKSQTLLRDFTSERLFIRHSRTGRDCECLTTGLQCHAKQTAPASLKDLKVEIPHSLWVTQTSIPPKDSYRLLQASPPAWTGSRWVTATRSSNARCCYLPAGPARTVDVTGHFSD